MILLSFQNASPAKVLFPRTAQVFREGNVRNGALQGLKELGWGVVTASPTKKYQVPNYDLCSPRDVVRSWISFAATWVEVWEKKRSHPSRGLIFCQRSRCRERLRWFEVKLDTRSVCVDAFAAVPVKQCKAKFSPNFQASTLQVGLGPPARSLSLHRKLLPDSIEPWKKIGGPRYTPIPDTLLKIHTNSPPFCWVDSMSATFYAVRAQLSCWRCTPIFCT